MKNCACLCEYTNKTSIMERLKQLIELRQELAKEEQALKEARKIIQKQINALDIEKLHLESVAKRPEAKPTNLTDIHTFEHDDKPKELDLDVPNRAVNFEEEEDDEDL